VRYVKSTSINLRVAKSNRADDFAVAGRVDASCYYERFN